jgi:very-short-patch-repair endonuclease
MDVSTALERSGGLATRAALIRGAGRAEVDRALRDGALVRVGQGRYALPGVDAAAAVAHAMNGHLALTSAALHHGWEVKAVPDLPHVAVPRKRKVSPARRRTVVLHRADLSPDDVSGIATSREVTLLGCLRNLPDDEALVIADSALRHGEDVTLRRVLAQVRGAGRAKVLRIGRAADARSANPFESVMRAVCLQVPGLEVVPQAVISSSYCWARADLVDRVRRIVIECDSYEWHGDRAGFRKDVRRYTLLVADGWTVLRFTWEDVMLRPAWVRDVLCRVVGVDARTELQAAWPLAA